MHRYWLLGFLVFCAGVAPGWAFAQSEDQDLDQIEAEIKNNEGPHTAVDENTRQTPPESSSAPAASEKIENLADLSKLQPFSEVSVLQRRYMPKTGRVQLFAGLSSMLNDPWNSTYGGDLRAAYGFTEAWGLELTYYFMSSSPTWASQNLLSAHGVSANAFGATTGFLGGSIMWTPIYGKLSLFNKQIIPFDMYFSLGGGNTSLSGASNIGSASGLSVGTGQIYSITRSVGFRWDLTLNTYSISSGATNNLLLTLGANWYFPEASYR